MNSTVSISSNNCNIVLSGICNKLIVLGNNNNVRAERVNSIHSSGNQNVLTWAKDPAPVVSNPGNYNTVTKISN